MTKGRPIDKKGKLNIQWFPLKKKRRKKCYYFQLSIIINSIINGDN